MSSPSSTNRLLSLLSSKQKATELLKSKEEYTYVPEKINRGILPSQTTLPMTKPLGEHAQSALDKGKEESYEPETFNRAVLPNSGTDSSSSKLTKDNDKDIEQLILDLRNQLADLKDLIDTK